MSDPYFCVHLLNSILVAVGHGILLTVLIPVLRIRSPRLSQGLWGLAALHAVWAFVDPGVSGVLNLSVFHDGHATWYSSLRMWDEVLWWGYWGTLGWFGLWYGTRACRARRIWEGLVSLAPKPAPDLAAMVQRVAAGLSISPPQVRVVSGLGGSPFVLGIRRPVLILPSSVCRILEQSELEAVVAHELAHIRRWDGLWNFCCEVLRLALFFNVPLHWLLARYQHHVERVCDREAARFLGEGMSLARGLVRVLGAGVSVSPKPCLASSTLIRPSVRRTRDRVRSLQQPPSRKATVALQLLLLVLMIPAPPREGGGVGVHRVDQLGNQTEHSRVAIGFRAQSTMPQKLLVHWLLG